MSVRSLLLCSNLYLISWELKLLTGLSNSPSSATQAYREFLFKLELHGLLFWVLVLAIVTHVLCIEFVCKREAD